MTVLVACKGHYGRDREGEERREERVGRIVSLTGE
jgi:hypothetical protein